MYGMSLIIIFKIQQIESPLDLGKEFQSLRIIIDGKNENIHTYGQIVILTGSNWVYEYYFLVCYMESLQESMDDVHTYIKDLHKVINLVLFPLRMTDSG